MAIEDGQDSTGGFHRDRSRLTCGDRVDAFGRPPPRSIIGEAQFHRPVEKVLDPDDVAGILRGVEGELEFTFDSVSRRVVSIEVDLFPAARHIHFRFLLFVTGQRKYHPVSE